MFVVVFSAIRLCGLIAVEPPFISEKVAETDEVVLTLPKLIRVCRSGCSVLPLQRETGAELVQLKPNCVAVPFPLNVEKVTTEPPTMPTCALAVAAPIAEGTKYIVKNCPWLGARKKLTGRSPVKLLFWLVPLTNPSTEI